MLRSAAACDAQAIAPNLGCDDAGVELLYANARAGEMISLVVAFILATGRWQEMGTLHAGGWLAAMLSVVLARGALRRAFHRRVPIAGDSRQWGRAFAVGAVTTGLLWGMAAQVLLTSPALDQSFVVMLAIAGMTSAAVPYLAPVPLVFHLYAAAAVLPAALRFLLGPGR